MASKQMFRCQVMKNIRAGKKSSNGRSVIYKEFITGQKITASPDNGSGIPSNGMMLFKTPDGFLIPASNIHVIGPLKESSAQKTTRNEEIEYAKVIDDSDYIDKKQFSKTEGLMKKMGGGLKLTELTKSRSKSAINASLIGAGIGLVYALAKRQNKWLFLTIGAVGGYVIGNGYSNFMSDDNKESSKTSK